MALGATPKINLKTQCFRKECCNIWKEYCVQLHRGGNCSSTGVFVHVVLILCSFVIDNPRNNGLLYINSFFPIHLFPFPIGNIVCAMNDEKRS